jgi:hypothetical protein
VLDVDVWGILNSLPPRVSQIPERYAFCKNDNHRHVNASSG